MINAFIKLEDCINNCLLHKLSKGFHESNVHPEYKIRSNKLQKYIPILIEVLENENLKEHSQLQSSTLYSLLILCLELETVGPWNTENEKIKKFSDKLNNTFKSKYGVSLKDILKHSTFNSQELFDKCIKELHQKMTFDDLKRYPALIEVYCLLIKNVKEYKVVINPVSVLPVSLLLIDDYVTDNKVKGLHCCTLIMQSLKSDDFATGNYYEVVYRNLKKNFVEKDLEVTKHLFQCYLEFLKILPPAVQKNKLDDIFSDTVDQLLTESNLYRKVECFSFLTKIIEMHGVHCVKKKVFKDIISDNIELCTNCGVSEMLLNNVLECLEIWIKYCWCVWKLSSHSKILSSLIKIIYVSKDELTLLKVQELILTLLKLCSNEEQDKICANLTTIPKCANTDFVTRLDEIKLSINS